MFTPNLGVNDVQVRASLSDRERQRTTPLGRLPLVLKTGSEEPAAGFVRKRQRRLDAKALV
jgi:hypothetical protein